MSSIKTIVVGLGNPGGDYHGTRHNVGFDVLDRVASQRALRFKRDRWLRPQSWIAEDGELLLVKPKTYMNHSGVAVDALCASYSTTVDQLIAVYDDADLPLGQLRLRVGGGHGGHNGVRSIIRELNQDRFGRIRLGVAGEGRRERGLAEYLLDRFEPAERGIVDRMIAIAAESVECAIEFGMAQAMNRFNGRSAMGNSRQG